ncbi:hypothetical protein LINPERPRIM_LOCUS16525 [Linum perenne]
MLLLPIYEHTHASLFAYHFSLHFTLNPRSEMDPRTQSILFVLLLVSVGVMAKAAEATIGACSIELNPNGCAMPGCQEQCFLDHGGWGHCAHDTVADIFHCVCYYSCPPQP